MNPLKWFRRRDDEEAAAESVAVAGRTPRNHAVFNAAVTKWNLTDDQKQFLLKLLDSLGPLFVTLLRLFLKV